MNARQAWAPIAVTSAFAVAILGGALTLKGELNISDLVNVFWAFAGAASVAWVWLP